MSKKNLFLGGILLVLIFFAYIYNGPFQTWEQNKGKPDNFLTNVNLEKINKILISKNGKETALELVGDKWRIAGTKDFYVKDDVMSTAIDSLKKAQSDDLELVSENKEKKNKFETGDNGIDLKLQDGDNLIEEFIIGKTGNDFKSSYISSPKDDKTYLVNAPLNSSFGKKDWYDKTIFSGDKKNINKIRFQYPDREFSIEKQDEKWTGVSPYKFNVSEEKIKDILNIMSNLNSPLIPEQKFEGSGLEKNSIIVEASGDGFSNVLMVGDAYKPEGSDKIAYYYAKKGSSDNIYLITKEQKENLDKHIWELK